MNLISHYPKTDEKKKELGRKTALIHSQAIFQYIGQLSCPNDQKQALLAAILRERTKD